MTPRSAQSGRGSQSVLSHRRTARFFGLALLVCLHFFAATICEAIVIAWDARNDNGEWDSIESPVGGNGTDNWTFGIPGEDDTALFADEYLINPIRTIDLVDNQAVDAVFLQGVGQYTLGTVVGAETLTIGEGSDAGGVSLGSVSAVAGDALSILNCNVAMNDTSGDNVFAVSVTDQRKLSINGIVSGSNALRKRGWGTLTLSNANSYSGGTIIAEGTLIAANTAGSATGAGSVKVEALSHLSGTGRIGGAITVDANGTIAPGNSIGTLTALAGVTLNGTYACEIGGGSADQLAVTGTLDVRNATLDLSELSVPTGTSYTIATATQVQGPFAAVTGLRTGLSITYSSTSIVIERSPVLYVDAAAAPGGSGTSWGSTSALDTLDEALAYAIPGDQIWVKEGVYTPGEGSSDPASTFDVPDGIQLLGGFAGTETTASQRDPAAHPTILSGDLGNDDFTNVDGITISPAWIRGTNAYSVVTVSFSAPVIDGFVITGGSAPLTSIGNPGGESRGGGVFIDTDFAHVPTLSNCRFYGNAAVQGGAIFVHSYGGAEIESCDFRSNSATGRGGAAYYWWSNITTTNSNFSGNHAGDDGGAIFDDPQDKGSTIYVNCTITGNSSVDKGGGISNSTSATTVREMHNTLIWNNQAQGTSSTSNSSLSGSAGYDFSHCLVQHVDLTDSGTNNLDGTDAGNDPGFFFPLDPSKAPRMSGDFTFAKPTGMATIQGNNQRFFVAEKDGIVWEFPDIGAATPGRSVFMDFTDPA
ncbi:MAG: autotransporter-associated beta strand repeat-containing protein, partial [Haloferula sp.]